jgi:hypothetical protein
MQSTENPAFVGGEGDVEAALKGGNVTAEEAVILMEKKLEARIRELEAKVDHGAVVNVKSVLARLGEAPPNFHQLTVFAAVQQSLPQDSEVAPRVSFPVALSVSAAIVLLQLGAAIGVLIGTIIKSCSSNDQCPAGSFCRIDHNNRCGSCGDDNNWLAAQTDPATGMTFNLRPDRDGFVGYNLTQVDIVCRAGLHDADLIPALVANQPNYDPSAEQHGSLDYETAAVIAWCEACVHPVDGEVNPHTGVAAGLANIAAMSPADWVALVVSALVVSLTITGELKDIRLCETAVVQAGGKIGVRTRIALKLLGSLRRRVFLPALLFTIPMLVVNQGGDLRTYF